MGVREVNGSEIVYGLNDLLFIEYTEGSHLVFPLLGYDIIAVPEGRLFVSEPDDEDEYLEPEEL